MNLWYARYRRSEDIARRVILTKGENCGFHSPELNVSDKTIARAVAAAIC